jgi:hypothetical protein
VLRAAVARGGFIAVVGDAVTGKSRTAFEAIRSVRPDDPVVVPSNRKVLRDLAKELPPRCIVWLDDLDQWTGADGLTLDVLNQIVSERRRLVIATLRSREYHHYTSGSSRLPADP